MDKQQRCRTINTTRGLIASRFLMLLAVLVFAVASASSVLGAATLNVYPLELTTTADGAVVGWSTDHVTDGSHSTHLQTTGAVGTGKEARIVVQASDIGIATLNDLSTISWDAYVADGGGYLPHADVYLDLNNNGVYDSGTDDVLVFEYAKVDNTTCDNAPYPTGDLYNTFGGKGSIGENSYAWLNSGDAGPCGGATFYSHSLTGWKAGLTENGKAISGSSKVLRVEIEVDNWISQSEAYVDNIKINGNNVYGLIQDAIGATTATLKTINVAAGTYNENVVITGTGKDNLIITGAGNSTLVEPSSGIGFAITDSDGVKISNLKIHTTGTNAHGIWVGGSSDGYGGVSGLTVQDTTIVVDGYSGGIYGSHSSPAHSGWLIGGVGHGNHITINKGAGVTGDGLDLYDVSDTEVSYNDITLNDPTGSTNVLWFSEWSNLDHLTFSNNVVSGSSGSEVAIVTDFINTAPDTSISTVTVSGNTFTNWGSRGLRIGEGVTGVTVSDNKFLDSGEALKNEDASQVGAEENWWGAADGPGGIGQGSGSTISGNVDYEPWWADEAMTLRGESIAPDTSAVEVSPSPARAGSQFTVTAHVNEDNFKEAMATIYNSTGEAVASQTVASIDANKLVTFYFTLGAPGVYDVVVLSTDNALNAETEDEDNKDTFEVILAQAGDPTAVIGSVADDNGGSLVGGDTLNVNVVSNASHSYNLYINNIKQNTNSLNGVVTAEYPVIADQAAGTHTLTVRVVDLTNQREAITSTTYTVSGPGEYYTKSELSSEVGGSDGASLIGFYATWVSSTVKGALDWLHDNAVLTTTVFDEDANSDATVAGEYDALDIRLKDNSVGSGELADNAVDTGAIQNNAVTGAKIANGAVTTDKLNDSYYSQEQTDDILGMYYTELETDAYFTQQDDLASTSTPTGASLVGYNSTFPTTVKAALDQIFATFLSMDTQFSGDASGPYNDLQLGSGVVGSTEIADNSVTADDIAADAVGTSEIAADAVTNSELANNAVDTAAIQDSAVTDAKVVDTITASNYLPLAGGTLTGDLELDGSALITEEISSESASGTVHIQPNADSSGRVRLFRYTTGNPLFNIWGYDSDDGAQKYITIGVFDDPAFTEAGASSRAIITSGGSDPGTRNALELQSPDQVRITAVDDNLQQGKVRIAADTYTEIHSRTSAETDASSFLILDREGDSSSGAATIETNNGDLALNPASELVRIGGDLELTGTINDGAVDTDAIQDGAVTATKLDEAYYTQEELGSTGEEEGAGLIGVFHSVDVDALALAGWIDMDNVQDALDWLHDNLVDAQDDISALEENVDELQSDVGDLQDEDSSLQEQIDSLEDRAIQDGTGVDIYLRQGWNTFKLPWFLLTGTNQTNALDVDSNSVEDVLNNIDGSYDYLAYYNGTDWQTHVPDDDATTFTLFPNESTNQDYDFHIHMTEGARLMIDEVEEP